MKEVLTLVISLIIVLGLIYLTYWLSQKTIIPHLNGGQSKYLKIVDRLILGREKSILIIKVQQQHYLVAVSEQDVKILEKLDSDFDSSQINEQPQQFNTILQGVFKQKTADQGESERYHDEKSKT